MCQVYCSIAYRCFQVAPAVAQVGSSDPHIAMLLLCQCGGFCRLIHLARTIPPSLAGDALSLFDDEVWQCFAECTAVDTPDFTWQQAQLSLSRGGLGLRHVSYHSPAAYLASVQAYLMRFNL